MPSPISTFDRVGGTGVASSAGRLSSSSAAALLLTPASPARGTNRPAISTPDSTLTTTNITSEYATPPTRLGVKGMPNSVREEEDPAESLFPVSRTNPQEHAYRIYYD